MYVEFPELHELCVIEAILDNPSKHTREELREALLDREILFLKLKEEVREKS